MSDGSEDENIEAKKHVIFKVVSKAFLPEKSRAPPTNKMVRIKNSGEIPNSYFTRFIKKIIESARVSMTKNEFQEMLKKQFDSNQSMEVYIDPEDGYAEIKNGSSGGGENIVSIFKLIENIVKASFSKNKDSVINAFGRAVGFIKKLKNKNNDGDEDDDDDDDVDSANNENRENNGRARINNVNGKRTRSEMKAGDGGNKFKMQGKSEIFNKNGGKKRLVGGANGLATRFQSQSKPHDINASAGNKQDAGENALEMEL
jgi:hypothetical protein